jgi:hypothetical protein
MAILAPRKYSSRPARVSPGQRPPTSVFVDHPPTPPSRLLSPPTGARLADCLTSKSPPNQTMWQANHWLPLAISNKKDPVGCLLLGRGAPAGPIEPEYLISGALSTTPWTAPSADLVVTTVDLARRHDSIHSFIHFKQTRKLVRKTSSSSSQMIMMMQHAIAPRRPLLSRQRVIKEKNKIKTPVVVVVVVVG